MSQATIRPGLAPYLYTLPAVAVLGVFFLVPTVQVAYYSLTEYTVFADPEWVGLGNYRRLIASGWFWMGMLNSFLYLFVTPALIALSLLAATVVHANLRGERLLRLLLFLPVITPTIVAAIAWRALLREDDGLINAVLAVVGLGPVEWLTERPWTLISPMLVTLWKGFGFYMMIFLAGLLSVPRELHEAAALDGAGRAAVARHVVLPSIAPLLVLVTIISSISALKVFDELFVTVRGVPVDHMTAVPLVYETAFVQGEFGLACAVGMLLFAVILVFSLVNLRLSRGAGS
ncbi:MAG: carbohydrate ABC transporter permease [Phycisphaerales bacterium]